jgi:hypothetical protein
MFLIFKGSSVFATTSLLQHYPDPAAHPLLLHRGSESGSISQRLGSADPDPDPCQNVMDPQHWFLQLQHYADPAAHPLLLHRGSESGSSSQRLGSADPDPDPCQNVMDPQHWFLQLLPCCSIILTQLHIPSFQCCGTVTIYYGSGSGSGSDF